MTDAIKKAPVTPITPYRIKGMRASFKRVLLNQLGVSMSRMPKSVSDITNEIVKINETDPDNVRKWYNIIVLGKLPGTEVKLPQDVQQQVDHAKQQFVSVLRDTALDEIIDKAATHLKEKQKTAQTELTQYAKQAMLKAADNYRPIVIKQGKKSKKLKGVFPEEFPRMVQLASQRIPIMLVGPAGCGKTYIAGKIAEALDLEAYDQSCSEGISESNFTGWKLPDKTGAFVYVPAPFIIAYEKGGVFLLDEMDSADANLLTFLNKAIANDYFFLPQRSEKPKVVKHKDFIPVAAANTFGTGADAQYVGRNALDAATLDRFRCGMIYMDYSAPVEDALVDPEILVWGRTIRQKIKDHKLFRIMSTRVMLDLTKMKQNCEWEEEEWNNAYFADWSADERRLAA